jgi:serine/threonine-protein kinase
MSPDRLRQIEEIYHAAVELPADDRVSFLNTRCGDDAELRREVESLLSFDRTSDSLLDSSPDALAAELLSEQEAEIVGRQIGRYQVLSLLGKGGMGEVFLAADTSLGRKIALKLLPAHFTTDRERVRRFEKEARAASALNHPNIITIYDVGQVDGLNFIATEFVEGETLRELMQQRALTISEVLDIGVQTAGALAAAHTAGIVHRDIKPANIMVRRDGYIKVLDFGLAKLLATNDPAADSVVSDMTHPGRVMGTVSYMSPEQARGQAVDERADVWTLGVVLYELVTRRLPFEGETSTDCLASIIRSEPLPLSQFVADAPAKLQQIIGKALTKNRDERYQNATELLGDLRSLKQELDLDATAERSEAAKADGNRRTRSTEGIGDIHTTSSAEYIVQQVRRHQRGFLVGVTALVLATAAAGYFIWSRRANAGAIQSIAVLPLVNASGDPNMEYLSDGISDSLTNNLSQISGMKVIAKASAFKYKGQQIDPQQVANALGVAAIVTGRVQQQGENLLISVELIDARDRTQLWGADYDRRAADLLAVQSDISEEITRRLRLRLTPLEQRQINKSETTNPQAYELLLRGRFYRDKAGKENRKKCVDYFQQAIAADPNYALAYAELSRGYRGLTNSSLMDPKEGSPKALEAARKALELDDNLADAHLAMAGIKQDLWDWGAAGDEFKRAIDLNPGYARGQLSYAYYLSAMGRHEQAIAAASRARELDPVSPIVRVVQAWMFFFAGQYDASIDAANQALELEPNQPTAHLYLGYSYTAKGMYSEAIAKFQHVIKDLDGDTPSVELSLATAYARAGRRENAQEIIKKLQANGSYTSPYELATVSAALGDNDQAFDLLEKGYAAHDLQMQNLNVDPLLDSLHSDRRFADLVHRLGLAPG